MVMLSVSRTRLEETARIRRGGWRVVLKSILGRRNPFTTFRVNFFFSLLFGCSLIYISLEHLVTLTYMFIVHSLFFGSAEKRELLHAFSGPQKEIALLCLKIT